MAANKDPDMGTMPPLAAPRTPISRMVTEDWRTQPEVRVRFRNLPRNVQTIDLYKPLSVFGNIKYLNVHNNNRNTAEATICFSPPPAEPFWTVSNYIIVINDREWRVLATLEKFERTFDKYVASPCRRGVQYPETSTLHPNHMHFGFLKDPESTMAMKTVVPTATGNDPDDPQTSTLKVVLDLKREKKLKIYFPVVMRDPRPSDSKLSRMIPEATPIGDLDRVEYFRMDIALGEMGTVSKVKLDESQWGLVVYLPIAPTVWKMTSNIDATLEDNPYYWIADRDLFRRSTHAVYIPAVLEDGPLSLRNDLVEIDFGRWTTYVLTFDANSVSWMQTWPVMESALGDFNIPVQAIDKFSIYPREQCKFWQMLDGPDAASSGGEGLDDLSFLSYDQPRVDLPWEVRYQLESCISHGVLNEYDITLEFLQTLADVAAGNFRGIEQEIVELFQHENMPDEEREQVQKFFGAKETTKGKNPAAILLESLMDPKILEECEERGNRIWDPMTIFSKRNHRSTADAGSGLVHYCTLARKAVVTPTAVLFRPPTVEISNRVSRRYAEYGDFFLRVQFADERGKVQGQRGQGYDEVWARIFDVLKNGITIGGRTFQYLACGSSQLREHGAHLFCPTSNITPDSIRAWMGDFSDITVPAKYSARLGQCFSTTRAIRSITVPALKEIPDIERNGYVFTDGVGKISQFLAQFIADEFGLNYVPSAFQIRLGGCKGMLVVWPDVVGKEVHYRPSQKKFDAESKALEVVRVSQPGTAYLNRQTIIILESLGVEAEVFLSLQEDQMERYEESMTDAEVAVETIGKSTDQYNITTMIATMIRSGFMKTKEPFLLSLLHLWKAWSLKMLKEKARILVDKSAFVFGVTDETGILKGHAESKVRHLISADKAHKLMERSNLPEIFLQVPDRVMPGKYTIITGLCVVGRNPSLHPGDMRVVIAVDKPELRHLKDVVVFPSNGDRPLPSMCSGGDLDGDDFFVLWDERLLPPEWNYPAMNYRGPAPDTKDKVKVVHLIQFFVQYMKNDSLGRIAHAHLAKADWHTPHGGAKHAECKELADLHSRAVDYVKTGAVAQMPQRLSPKGYPHFMEKRRGTYHSRSALGKLYDSVMRVTREGHQPGPAAADKVTPQPQHQRSPFDFRPEYETPFDERILSKCPPDSNSLLKKSRKIKTQYDAAMRRLMSQREIRTEFELFTAFVMTKPRLGSDYELQSDVGREALALKQRFRAMVVKEVGSKEFERLAPFVAAMYRVTQQEVKIALHEASTGQIFEEGGTYRLARNINETTMPLTSFPWIFDKVLCRIALMGGSGGGSDDVKGNEEHRENQVPDGGAEKRMGDMATEWGYSTTADGLPLHHGQVLDIGFPRHDYYDPDADYYLDPAELVPELGALGVTVSSGSGAVGGEGKNSAAATATATPPVAGEKGEERKGEARTEDPGDDKTGGPSGSCFGSGTGGVDEVVYLEEDEVE